MTVSLEMPAAAPAQSPPASLQGQMLLRVLNVLERVQIPCCILHGYESYPDQIPGDVDCLIPARFLPGKLAAVLHGFREEIGARIVQWFDDGAHLVVLAGLGPDGTPVMLQLHVCTEYEMAGRVFFSANEILATRQRRGEFYIPATGVEFACVLANKLAKGKLTDDHRADCRRCSRKTPTPAPGRSSGCSPSPGAKQASQNQSGMGGPPMVSSENAGRALSAAAGIGGQRPPDTNPSSFAGAAQPHGDSAENHGRAARATSAELLINAGENAGRTLPAAGIGGQCPPYANHGRAARATSAELLIDAASKGDWQGVQSSLGNLQIELLANSSLRRATGKPARLARKILRWLRPKNGFHAVFLGPDGVGKSTTIESFQRDLAPAFLSSLYLTFAPGLLPQKFAPPKPNGPHSLPPRSLPASLLKAAWWSVCYTLGYYATIHPTLARGGLVVNHRYLIDAIVDQKRYRYSGPVWMLKWIWAIAPKPDVVILLDADPEIIQRRKQEVPPEETARQVQAYRRVIGALSIGKIIDAAQPRRDVATQVEWLVLDRQAERIVRRFSLGGIA